VKATDPIMQVLGAMPNRLQLAGGWIDQPFVSRHNPKPPGSMVVVQIEPNFRPMDRSGFASSTRAIAMRIWKGNLPNRPPEELARELYEAENNGKAEPSGSQDMIGLIYPGINRLDYDFAVKGGVYPAHIESLNDARIARWLENVLQLLPVEPRPAGYSLLGKKNLDPKWVARLGQSGQDCFEAIRRTDVAALGASLNLNMKCWETLLPHVVRHPLIKVDLLGLLKAYQRRYSGAMYSGCGGGYLMVVSDEPIPGAFKVNIRLAKTL
jgi:galactokinase/mevalonate kinase-like predicted kinase